MPSLPFGLLDRWLSPAPPSRKVEWIGQGDFAHRGLHGAGVPENSIAAFQAAIEAGHGIELDIQRSRDGQAIVFHDATLERLSDGEGPVNRWSAAQLGAIHLEGTAQTVPTLRQALSCLAGRVPVLIEIKSKGDSHVSGRCLAVRRVLEGYTGAHAVMSFDPRVSAWFRRHSAHTVRGLVVTEDGNQTLMMRLRRRLALWRARPDFLAYDIRDLPSPFAQQQRDRGLPVATWTVRSAQQAEAAAHYADADIFEIEPGAERRA